MTTETNELNDIKDEFEIKFKSLRCKLNNDDSHFLNEPKILPCSNSACYECILKSIDTNTKILNCSFCKSEHLIENVKKLESNESIIDQINSNCEDINEELIEKLNKYINDLTNEFSTREEAIENLCIKAKKEISERIEAIKNHLDVLHKEMLDSLAIIKENVTKELEKLNEQVQTKTEEYEKFTENMQKMMGNFDENRDTIEKEIYNCQDYIDELTTLDQNFHKILRKVSFEASEWEPDEPFICNYIGNFNLNELIDSDSDDD